MNGPPVLLGGVDLEENLRDRPRHSFDHLLHHRPPYVHLLHHAALAQLPVLNATALEAVKHGPLQRRLFLELLPLCDPAVDGGCNG